MGILILDRYLQQNGINPRTLSLLDRLALVGSTGCGALEFRPDKSVRSIGGVAPSKYIQKLFKENIDTESIKRAICTHKIDFNLLNEDNFDEFIRDRAIKLLDCIEKATGKVVTGKDSQETIDAFGSSLL